MKKLNFLVILFAIVTLTTVVATDVTISGKVIGFKPGVTSTDTFTIGANTIEGEAENIEDYSTVQSPMLQAFVAPTETEADGAETTDLSSGYDETSIQSVSNYVWHRNSKGKIKWKAALNFSGISNLDSVFEFGEKFAFVDSATYTQFQTVDANITFENIDCSLCGPTGILYASGAYTTLGDIQANGEPCGAPRCTNFQCAANTCTFDVTGFTGYAYGANSNLTINDTSDSSTVNNGTSISFYAYYVNSTSGNLITGATCQININGGGWTAMDESASYYNHTVPSGYQSSGNFEVNCTHASYTDLNTTDGFTITQTGGGGGAIPEFSDYAIVLILVLAVGGFFYMKKRK